LDEYVGTFLVADELRQALLVPDSEGYSIFSEADRQEFIFHLFKSLVLGGGICQYEDSIEPYLQVTRKLYKDLICVKKEANTGKLVVASHVFKLLALAPGSFSPLFPMEHPQNFAFLSIDPIKRHIHFLYHASQSYY
jgi:cilia- and flagella-associated protein 300